MATIRNVVVEQGTSFTLSINTTDANNDPLDLSGYGLHGQVRKSYYTSSYVSFTVASAVPTSGDITISLTSAQTAALKAGRYVYDLKIVSSGGEVTRILEGILSVTPEVTKITTSTTTTTTTAAPTTTTTTSAP